MNNICSRQDAFTIFQICRTQICSRVSEIVFLRQLWKFHLPRTMLVNLYTAIIRSIITSAIIWFPAAAAKDKAKLQRVIRSAERVIGCPLPPLEALFRSRALRRARKIMSDPAHPGHSLFVPLPSGRRLQAIKTAKARHWNSFFPTVIQLLNDAGAPPAPRPNTTPPPHPHLNT